MRPNFQKADVDGMRKVVHRDWLEVMAGKNVNEMWLLLKESLGDAVTLHVPLRKTKRTDEPKWLDTEVRRKIAAKRRA